MSLSREDLPPLPLDWEWDYYEPYGEDTTSPPSAVREREGWDLEISVAGLGHHYTPTFQIHARQGDGTESDHPSAYVFSDIPLVVFTQLDHALRLFFGIP